MLPPGKNCGETTKLSVDMAMRPLAGSAATPASLPSSSSGDPKASKKTSSMMRFIICPPEPWPNRSVLSVMLWDISKTPIVGGVSARGRSG